MAEIKSELLRPLSALDHYAKGPLGYYLELRKADDPYLAVGAWKVLLDGRHLTKLPELWEELVAMCRYGAIKQKGFDFLERDVLEHDLAARAARTPSESLAEALADDMTAQLTFDAEKRLDGDARAFLATGNPEWLGTAHDAAEEAGGWRRSLPWTLRSMLLEPSNMQMQRRLLDALDGVGDGALLREYADILSARRLLLPVSQLFLAAAEFYERKPQETVNRLRSLIAGGSISQPPFSPLQAPMLQLKAKAEEAGGGFRDAYGDFLAMNASENGTGVDAEDFYRKTAAKKRLDVPALPPDPRTDVVQMLGFPRSGTTLLENALAAHPLIDTFEEIPALTAAIDVVEMMIRRMRPMPATTAEIYLQAREKYYEEIDIRRRKPGAMVHIDKLPLRSSEADFLTKLFPDWRYIFSIRHPYDVVLSCFKQRFAPNPAMENFRTIDKAVRAYDHTMTEWFAVHTLDDPNVHYVRYENLVTDFQTVMSGALAFLGLEWDDAVRDFARAAEARGARTPSYQKVRQGVALGVQTYWENYEFVFEGAIAERLQKWVDLFGYGTAVGHPAQ